MIFPIHRGTLIFSFIVVKNVKCYSIFGFLSHSFPLGNVQAEIQQRMLPAHGYTHRVASQEPLRNILDQP